jgi:MFS family permease
LQVWPLAIGEFLVAIDTTIVLSAYASIGTDLNALQSTSWIATAYLLTSTSFMWALDCDEGFSSTILGHYMAS